ncbi:hypothetical protein J6590_051391 [Homalodisca vitripennis]|nr:hypothetical protein J6590_051391 [Homalodisca vitripennis]
MRQPSTKVHSKELNGLLFQENIVHHCSGTSVKKDKMFIYNKDFCDGPRIKTSTTPPPEVAPARTPRNVIPATPLNLQSPTLPHHYDASTVLGIPSYVSVYVTTLTSVTTNRGAVLKGGDLQLSN